MNDATAVFSITHQGMFDSVTSVYMAPWLSGSGQSAQQTMNEFTLFVDICLIPLSNTCSFDVAAMDL